MNRRKSLKLLCAGSLTQLFGLNSLNELGKAYSSFPFSNTDKMKIAYILFDGITYLDFIGIYDPISRIQSKGFMDNISWDLCTHQDSEEISDSLGLTMKVDKIRPDLSAYDMIIIPGGLGTRKLQFDKGFNDWLRTAENVIYKASVCTGSLLLGSAGFLKERIATTHFNEYETLKPYCKTVIKERIVEDGNIITAGAVGTSLDLGLYICNKLVGAEKTEIIRKSMNYIPSEFSIIKN